MKYISLIILTCSFLSMSAQNENTYHSRRDWFVGRYEGVHCVTPGGDTTGHNWWPCSLEITYVNDSLVDSNNNAWNTRYKICEDSIMMNSNTPNCDDVFTNFSNEFGNMDYKSGFAKLYPDSTIEYWFWSPPVWDDTWIYFKGKMVESYANVSKINKDEFKIYPNPTSGIFNIKTKKDIDYIVFYNLAGKKVKIIDLQQNHKNIDVRDLKTGLYFYKVIIEDKNVYSGKLMIK